jgi:hypothetical protein
MGRPIKQLPTKAHKIASMDLGNQFSGNKWFRVALDGLPEYLVPGNKAMVVGFETKIRATFGTLASDPALKSVYLHNVLDTEFYAAGRRIESRRGWHDPIIAALVDGVQTGRRAQDLAVTGGGGPGSQQRTFSKFMKFTDDRLASRLARCWPAISLAKGGAYLNFYLHAAAEAIKGVTGLSVTACTLDIYAHLLDVPAGAVIVPAFVETMSEEAKREKNPSPGLGQYMRIAMVNAPQNVGQGTSLDDMSAYTKINSFGVKGKPIVVDEDVDFLLRKFHAAVTDDVDPRPAAGPSATNKAETRLLDPDENHDALTKAIPLFYLRDGQDMSEGVKFYGSAPQLTANDNSSSSLPSTVDFLVQRVQSRDDKFTMEVVKHLSRHAADKALTVPRGYTDGRGNLAPGIDGTRIPLFADARE